MGEITKKILMTGFEPFGPCAFNPTQDFVQHYNNLVIGRRKDTFIRGIVLPSTYYGAFEKLREAVELEKPDAIISLGLSSGIRSVRIETVFRNLMNGKYPDADGYEPIEEPIVPGENVEELLASTADNVSLANLLYSYGISVELSAKAEFFIGNSLGYLTTRMIIEKKLPIKNAFVHIPWTDNYKGKLELGPNKIFFRAKDVYKALDIMVNKII